MAKKAATTRSAAAPKSGTYIGSKHSVRARGIYKSAMVLRGTGELVEIVKSGALVSDAGKLTKHFKMPVDRVALHISGSSTKYKRRLTERQFTPEESGRLVRLARLMNAAETLHDGDAEGARTWMESPKEALGGATPLEYAETEVGAREVEDLIGRSSTASSPDAPASDAPA